MSTFAEWERIFLPLADLVSRIGPSDRQTKKHFFKYSQLKSIKK